MADSKSPGQCGKCNKTEADLGRPLKQCAKCHRAQYCDRACQQGDWKQHKKTCRAPDEAPPPSTPGSGSGSSSTMKNLQQHIVQPFHRLNDKTWLHGRPETDVFKLLIDAYRLRMEDNYMFGDPDEDSLHAGAPSGLPGFRRFLRKAESRAGLLPSWWSAEKKAVCVAYGNQDGWSDLTTTVEKSDIVEHYGHPLAPMQLRMFGEQVIGTGPGGQKGDAMMQMQMLAESGEVSSSVMDASQLMR